MVDVVGRLADWVAQGKEVHMSITAGVVARYHLNPPTH